MARKPQVKTIGERIRVRREELGLTQIDLAERMKMGRDRQGEISQYGTGQIEDLHVSQLRRFAEALECTVGELVD